MEDEPIAAHGFGRGLAVDLLALLACGEVPEAVEVTCPIERFLAVNLVISFIIRVSTNIRPF